MGRTRVARGGLDEVLGEAVRGALGGAVGSGAMTLTARLRREAYARRRGIAVSEIDTVLDYDDSEHVVMAASTLLRAVLGWAPRGEAGRRALFWAVHWGYGSAMGAVHVGLQRALGRGAAPGLVFFAGVEALALSMFPLLGGTPPPWRWGRGLLATSVGQHAVYAGAVAATNRATAGRAR